MDLLLLLFYILCVNLAAIIMYRTFNRTLDKLAFYNGILGLILIPSVLLIAINGMFTIILSRGTNKWEHLLSALFVCNILLSTYFVLLRVVNKLKKTNASET